MHPSRVVAGTVAAILLLTVATGPLGLYDVPETQATDSLGEGNASITVVSVPERIPLEQGRYGNDEYHLRVPSAVVDVDNLTGNPILNYNLDIPAMGKSKSSVHFLGEAGEGRYHASFADSQMAAGEVTQKSYEARVELVIRTNGTSRVIHTQPATIEVVE
jgi:hypothetical protein